MAACLLICQPDTWVHTLSLTACQAIAFHGLVPQVQRQRSLSCTKSNPYRRLYQMFTGYSLLWLLCHKLMLYEINVILLDKYTLKPCPL